MTSQTSIVCFGSIAFWTFVLGLLMATSSVADAHESNGLHLIGPNKPDRTESSLSDHQAYERTSILSFNQRGDFSTSAENKPTVQNTAAPLATTRTPKPSTSVSDVWLPLGFVLLIATVIAGVGYRRGWWRRRTAPHRRGFEVVLTRDRFRHTTHTHATRLK